jgi:hypothetical protein
MQADSVRSSVARDSPRISDNDLRIPKPCIHLFQDLRTHRNGAILIACSMISGIKRYSGVYQTTFIKRVMIRMSDWGTLIGFW